MGTSTLVDIPELQSTGRCKSWAARNNRGREASSDSDVLMEQILEDLRSMPQVDLLKRIASLPEIRRGKVLNIRRQITKGIYPMEDRLGKAIGRILEAINT